jgi:hypothetical protein
VSIRNPFRARGSIVDALSSALDRGSHGLENVPGLLKQILADESWREFETARGEHVVHDRFADFVTTPPLKGLGASMEVILRIVGTADAELLAMLRQANKGTAGRPKIGDDSSPIKHGGGTSDYLAQRLEQEAPGEYAAVVRGERTINAAAIRAGFRPRRATIRLDSAESAAETLRKHMTPDQIRELRKLLED